MGTTARLETALGIDMVVPWRILDLTNQDAGLNGGVPRRFRPGGVSDWLMKG
ncbi:MAG: hypothetical protein HYV63_22780 [Candidatus Schekmanbacteria bacterium]|nr:hypothetical protein [Candidatus Schekmanbacteria bacterium]